MTLQIRKIAPEYLSFYIAGSRDVEIPLDMERRGIVASGECLNIPCLYWNDGDTTVTLGYAAEVPETRPADFDGILKTPDKTLVLFDANMPEIMRMSLPSRKTRVRVWINHPTEPDEVIIALGD